MSDEKQYPQPLANPQNDYLPQYTKNNVSDEAPPYQPVQADLLPQEFVFRHCDGRLKAFPSEKAMAIYDDAKSHVKSSINNPKFARDKEFQNASIGLPLLISEHASPLEPSEFSHLNLLDCKPTPDDPSKLYDKSDDREWASVQRQLFLGYYRYKIQLKDVVIVVIYHIRSRMADVQIGQERFRFFKIFYKSEGKSRRVPVNYKIYLLGPDQPSLVDDMDSSLTVKKDNPVLGRPEYNFFGGTISSTERAKFTLPEEYGYLKGCSTGNIFHKGKKCASLVLPTQSSGNPDSNDAVDFKTLALVAVSLVLQESEADTSELVKGWGPKPTSGGGFMP